MIAAKNILGNVYQIRQYFRISPKVCYNVFSMNDSLKIKFNSSIKHWLQTAGSLFLILVIVFYGSPIIYIEAATLSSVQNNLSNAKSGATGVTYTLNFDTATTSPIQEVKFQFATTSSGSTKPANLDLSSATLGSTSGLPGAWSFVNNQYSSGVLALTATTASSINSGTAITVPFSNLTNPIVGNCDSSTQTLSDVCYVIITTYSDLGITPIDTGWAGFTLVEDPLMTFDIQSVNSGSTNNGITTSLSSTSTTVPFNNLSQNKVVYVAQKLVITTNAPHGYTVNAYLADNVIGTYINGLISPFGATNATWDTPQLWSDPNGTTANSNTAWIGANTTDGNVPGWSGATNKFGPISLTKHTVSYSSTPAPSGNTIYVTYAIEANGIQPADVYIGSIIYNVQAIY
jgi:hypothetical protein